MKEHDLFTILASLSPPPQDSEGRQVYTVHHMPGCPAARIGLDSQSCPAFIISVVQNEPRPPLVPFALTNLDVRHGVNVVLVAEDGSSHTGLFSIIRCPSDDAELQELFVRCIGHALLSEAEALRVSEVNSLVEHLMDLFRLASAAPKGELLGLWAEMFVITQSSDPKGLLRAWRPTEYTHCDFGSTSERIEVKATMGAARKHHVSYEQANPTSNVSAWFISIMTEEIGSGVSLRALWNQCVSLAQPDVELIGKVDQNCLQTLGNNWAQNTRTCFDLSLACSSIRVYAAEEVPKITILPEGITGVRWVADFDRARPTEWTATTLTPMLEAIATGIQ